MVSISHFLFVGIMFFYFLNIINCFESQILEIKKGIKIGKKLQTRIMGGKSARLKQFPYQVGLAIRDRPNFDGGGWCGGTLISREWILTAGHCFYSLQSGWSYDVNITVGSTNLDDPNESNRKYYSSPAKNFKIRNDFYQPKRIYNDIGLIKLPEPIELNEYIQIANLPRRNMTKEELFGRTVYISGWGTHNTSYDDNILKYSMQQVFDFKSCDSFYHYLNDDKHICLYSSNSIGCYGDSGGPAVIKENDGTKTIIGIMSGGSPGGCKIGWPTILTRVSHYLDWISNVTGIKIRD